MADPTPLADAPIVRAPRPLRSDAARNHHAVLIAARELYAEGGLRVGFDEIARRAGVGVGTVYRRFPDRDALLSALFEARFAAVDELAQRALDAEDPWAGLELFIVSAVRMFAEDRGLREIAFDPTEPYEGMALRRERLAELLAGVTDRAHGAGVLRVDCRAQDVGSIIAMLSRLATPAVSGAAPASETTIARCTTFVLDGIRTRA